MKNFIKKLFTKENEISVDLKDWTLKEMLFNINEKSSQKDKEVFINSTLGNNHAVLTSTADARFKLYHYFTYYPNENKLNVTSHYAKTIWTNFIPSVLILTSVIFEKDWLAALPFFLAISLGFALFSLILLRVNLHSKASDVEREIIIRINYKFRNHGQNNM